MVLLQLLEDQQPLVVATLRLAIPLLPRATLEQGFMVMSSQPTMGLHSRQHTAKLCKGTGFLLEGLKVQTLPRMAILNHLAVEVLLLHMQRPQEVEPPSLGLQTGEVRQGLRCHPKTITGAHLVTKGLLATTTEHLAMTTGAPLTTEDPQLIIEAHR